MYAARSAKPKLSLSISAATNNPRPMLSLRSPAPMPRTPISPSPISPAYSGFQASQQTCAYTNSSTAKSILKKGTNSASSGKKAIQFKNTPTVYCVTPIENKDEYYGASAKLSRDERRWGLRS